MFSYEFNSLVKCKKYYFAKFKDFQDILESSPQLKHRIIENKGNEFVIQVWDISNKNENTWTIYVGYDAW